MGGLRHETILSVSYDDERRARLIAASVGQEIGRIDDDRSRATIEREGATVVVRIDAADPVALRAAINTWCSLVEVAERSADVGKSVSDRWRSDSQPE